MEISLLSPPLLTVNGTNNKITERFGLEGIQSQSCVSECAGGVSEAGPEENVTLLRSV